MYYPEYCMFLYHSITQQSAVSTVAVTVSYYIIFLAVHIGVSQLHQ